jgi:hypothetical protein
MVLEVVGPGFDTSDLLRSDVLPHERLEIRTPFRELEQRPRLALEVVQVYRVSELAYRKTVDERLVKIGARLINPAFPEDLLKTEEVERARLRERAVVHLTKSRETTLLRNMSAYRPIPARHAVRFAKGVLHVLAGLSNHGVVLGATAFSGTFTTSGRFIFWDFFPADSSQAGMLYKS